MKKKLKSFLLELEKYGTYEKGYFINNVCVYMIQPNEYWTDVDDESIDIILGFIETPEEFRGKGFAKKCLNTLTDLLDKYKLVCYLEADPNDKSFTSRITDFYKSFGWEPMLGIEMLRCPK